MASDLGVAYIQVMPSTKGIQSEITSAMNDGSIGKAGTNAGNSLVSSIKKVISVAAIGKLVKDSLDIGAAYQQSIGGVETLYKESADLVIANAQRAYETAGLSANAYMETVTSFSASLLASLSGDTEAAALAADKALVDMADNANKFGTDMSSIQSAYQGFAKQNYTMLDNLKLGYGGTKSEMERLLADAQELSGVEYDISNLADVYEAIHVVQESLGVAGATAQEAATTFSGSFAAMKAAGENVIAGLTLGEDIQPALQAFLSSIQTFAVNNLIPMVVNMANGIAQAAPVAVSALISGLLENLPSLIDSAVGIIMALVTGLIQALPVLIGYAPDIIIALVNALQSGLAQIIAVGKDVLTNLWNGIQTMIPTIKAKIPSVMTTIKSAFKSAVSGMADIGKNIVTGIWQGISGSVQWMKDRIKEWVGNVTDFIKNVWKIGSPSRVMADEVGYWVGAGVGVGWSESMKDVNKMIGDSIQTDYDVATTVGVNTALRSNSAMSVGSASSMYGSNSTDRIIAAIGDLKESGIITVEDPNRLFRLIRGEQRKSMKAGVSYV